MAGDFDKPAVADTYTAFAQAVRDLAADIAKGLDPALALGTANIPTNALRWNSANGYWEKFNGATWGALAASYAIDISGRAAKWTTGRTITLTGDVTGVSGAFDGSGNLSFAATLATVTAAKGGTGQTGYTTGDLLYASAPAAISKLAAVATGNVLLSGGVGTPSAWGKVGLTTHVSGTLALGNGGTGATDAAAARTALGLAIGTDVQAFMAAASQAEMEAGTEAALRAMSPLRVAQAIAALAAGGVVSFNGRTGAVTLAAADITGIDGTGTGIDADLLDGQHAAAFAAVGHTHSGYVSTDHGHNNVGSLLFGYCTNPTGVTAGTTYAGSTIKAASVTDTSGTLGLYAPGVVLSGTWRALGSGTNPQVTLFQRVA